MSGSEACKQTNKAKLKCPTWSRPDSCLSKKRSNSPLLLAVAAVVSPCRRAMTTRIRRMMSSRIQESRLPEQTCGLTSLSIGTRKWITPRISSFNCWGSTLGQPCWKEIGILKIFGKKHTDAHSFCWSVSNAAVYFGIQSLR